MTPPERRKPRMTDMIFKALVVVVSGGVLGGGWYARSYVADNLASKGEVVVAEAKADFVLDRQIEYVITQIAYLEEKKNKTPEEIAQLDYLRKQLDTMRQLRSGRSK